MNNSDKDPITNDIKTRLKKERKKDPVKTKKDKINVQLWLNLIIVILMLSGIVFSLINILR